MATISQATIDAWRKNSNQNQTQAVDPNYTPGLRDNSAFDIKRITGESNTLKSEVDKLRKQIEDRTNSPGFKAAQIMHGQRENTPYVDAELSRLNSMLGEASKKYDAKANELSMRQSGKNADGSAIRPAFQTLIDPKTGLLGNQFTLQDDYKNVDLNTAGLDQFRKEATRGAGTDSVWGNLQLQGAQSNAAKNLAQVDANQRSGLAGAYDDLAAQGGVTGGARERIARGGFRDVLANRQGARSALNNQMLDIRKTDEQNRIGQLSQLPGMEIQKGNFDMQNQENSLRTKEFDSKMALAEIMAGRGGNLDAWKTEMQTWGAGKSADAQAKAGDGGGGGGMCCFIFLEARYGNGTMDKVVRRYRDEHMTDVNRRGYYKLSEVLVPLMRKSKLVKFAVRAFMTDPMVSYGKYHYGEGKIGWIFKPVKNFWLKTFEYLGGDHKFIRENGELI